MMTMSALIMIIMLISSIILTITFILGEKSPKEREKTTPFECGFSPYKKARSPFSLRFFSTTLIFLIFDIEIALLLPIGILSTLNLNILLIWLALMVTIILLVGLLHEWKQGSLNWIN